MPPADVVQLFPLSRRVLLVDQTAHVLAVADAVKAERHWQVVLKRLRRELGELRISKETEDLELRRFYQAVEAQMHERATRVQDHPTGGHAA